MVPVRLESPQIRTLRLVTVAVTFLAILLVVQLWLASALGAQAPADAAFDSTLFDGMRYRMIGPHRGGRVTAVAGIAENPLVYFMGSTGGGIWKTEDAGGSWTNVADKYLESASVGAIDVADSDPSVIWAGMGSACLRGNTSMGDGVYRSLDGGTTWSHAGLSEAGQIGRIIVDPRDPDVAFVAALGHPFGPNPERGVFRTRDGGASWENVLFISDSTGAVDLAMRPDNPRIIFAGMWRAERKPWTMISGAFEGGIWRTKDGGDSWEQLEKGLPNGLVGRTAVSVSAADPDRVWALIEAPREKGGLYRSDDGGDSWKQVNKERKLRQRAWYYTHVYADPGDENTVYVLNVRFWKSIDGGKTFEPIQVLHGDTHDLWINPTNPRTLIIGDDGGAQVSHNGGESWSTMYNQPTAEMYRLFVDDQFPYRVYGSQQDNSTISLPSRGIGGLTPYENWRSVGGGESGHIAIDPRNPDVTYAGSYGGSITRRDYGNRTNRNVLSYPQLAIGEAAKNLRYRFQWNAPIRISPWDPDVLYHTSQYVHRSTNGGQSWETISPDLTKDDVTKQEYAGKPITMDNTGVEVYGTIFAFEDSPYERGVLWVGSDDGRVHISRDDGATWTDITPSAMPEGGTVNAIELSPHAPGRAFIAVYRYREDDFTPYIFRTNDYGASWSLLTRDNGIGARHFVRAIREDPERQGLLFAGTEYGMYISFDDGARWQPLQLNLPVTPITDLQVHHGDLVVATQGRSFWILDDLSPLRQLTEEVARSDAYLYEPANAYRARFGYNDNFGFSPDTVPGGALFHFYLAEAPTEQVALQILDESGEPIRTYTWEPKKDMAEGTGAKSESAAEDAGEAASSDEPFERSAKGDSISVRAGLNRANWNLRHEAPEIVEDAVYFGPTFGPMVAPGRYQVRLTIGDWSQTRGFELLPDPRVTLTAAEREAQYELMTRVRDRIQEAHDAIRTLRSVREQVKAQAKLAEEAGFGDGFEAQADSIASRLTAVEEQLMQTKNESRQDPLNFPPRLDAQLVYLYGVVGSADAPPTDGAYERFDDLSQELQVVLSELREVLDGEVAAFNAALAASGAPAIIVPE
ncbi:MAG: glycosyl hydrolase [Gemmatimonadales bacterium]